MCIIWQALFHPDSKQLYYHNTPRPRMPCLIQPYKPGFLLLLYCCIRKTGNPNPDSTRPGCKRRIDMGKALGHIFMHGRFTDPKFPGRLPHCRIVVYDVISDRNRPFLDIFLHGSSPENVFYILLHLFPVYANSLSQTKTLPISSSPHGGVSASRFSSRQLPTLPSPHRSRQAVPELPSDARFHPALP